MSDVGKEVFDNIGPGLQNAMNEGIENNPSLQGNNEKFKDFAYSSHFLVYKYSGIGKLGGNDLLRMVTTDQPGCPTDAGRCPEYKQLEGIANPDRQRL